MTPVITIDGPGGSGKGTVSKIIADQLHFNILDSGAMYRVLAYAALKNGIDLGDEDRLYDLGVSLNLTFTPVDDGVATVLDGEDISLRIRNEEVGGAASKIAAIVVLLFLMLFSLQCFRAPVSPAADNIQVGKSVRHFRVSGPRQDQVGSLDIGRGVPLEDEAALS